LQKIDYSFLKESEEEGSNDSEPEMFENVLEKSVQQEVIDGSDFEGTEEDTPAKPPPKKKLGPKPEKRKMVSSESESSPLKKKVSCKTTEFIEFKLMITSFYYYLCVFSKHPRRKRRRQRPVMKTITLMTIQIQTLLPKRKLNSSLCKH
jgi:hypothetical protein